MENVIDRHGKQASRRPISIAGACSLFGVLCALSIGLWWKPLQATILLAFKGDAYTQILLSIPVSIILIANEIGKAGFTPRPNPRAGIALLLGSLTVALAGVNGTRLGFTGNDVRLTFEVVALVVWWLGGFLLCFGTNTFRRCLFPLLFLLWLVPLPQPVVNGVVNILQRGTATVVRGMLVLFGIPVTQRGEILSLPGLTIEVAQECSSIRSSLLLLVCAMVTAYALLRSLWAKTVVIVAAVPLAIFKNGLRVFTLSVLSIYVDPAVMNGRLHRQGGVLFFAIALLLLLLLIWVLRKMEARRVRDGDVNAALRSAIKGTQITQQSVG